MWQAARSYSKTRDWTRAPCISSTVLWLCTPRDNPQLYIIESNAPSIVRCTILLSIRFSSVTQSCPTPCDTVNCSTPGLPVHHQLLKSTQIHVHPVGDAIQPTHPQSSPSPPAFNPSQHQGLFQWVNCLHEVAKALEFQLQHQSFQWTPRTDEHQDSQLNNGY